MGFGPAAVGAVSLRGYETAVICQFVAWIDWEGWKAGISMPVSWLQLAAVLAVGNLVHPFLSAKGGANVWIAAEHHRFLAFSSLTVVSICEDTISGILVNVLLKLCLRWSWKKINLAQMGTVIYAFASAAAFHFNNASCSIKLVRLFNRFKHSSLMFFADESHRQTTCWAKIAGPKNFQSWSCCVRLIAGNHVRIPQNPIISRRRS